MRIIRHLKKQIETEYCVDNAYTLAFALDSRGISELTDGIREKITYLQNICGEFTFDNHCFVTLVTNYSLDDIKERYKIYVKYVDNHRCEIDSLAFSCEKEEKYTSLLTELGLNSEQQKSVMRKVVKHGLIAKSEEDARSIIEDLKIFEISVDVRNQFISDNAEYLFNDYSREARQVFETLCQKYGKERGFDYLQEHPECIRFGMDEK